MFVYYEIKFFFFNTNNLSLINKLEQIPVFHRNGKNQQVPYRSFTGWDYRLFKI